MDTTPITQDEIAQLAASITAVTIASANKPMADSAEAEQKTENGEVNSQMDTHDIVSKSVTDGVDKWHNYSGLAPAWRSMKENRTIWSNNVPGFQAHSFVCPFNPSGYTGNLIKVNRYVPKEQVLHSDPSSNEAKEIEKELKSTVHVNEANCVCTCDTQLTPRQETLFKYITTHCFGPSAIDMAAICGFPSGWGFTTVLVNCVAYLMCELEACTNINVPDQKVFLCDITIFVKDQNNIIRFMDLLASRLESQGGRHVTTSIEKGMVSTKHASSHVHVGCRLYTHSVLKRASAFEAGTYVFIDDAFDQNSDSMPNLKRFVVTSAFRINERSTDPLKQSELRRFVCGGTCADSTIRGTEMSDWCNIRDLAANTKYIEDQDYKKQAVDEHNRKMEEVTNMMNQNKETMAESEEDLKKRRSEFSTAQVPRPLTEKELAQMDAK